jgi:hypothetical protein
LYPNLSLSLASPDRAGLAPVTTAAIAGARRSWRGPRCSSGALPSTLTHTTTAEATPAIVPVHVVCPTRCRHRTAAGIQIQIGGGAGRGRRRDERGRGHSSTCAPLCWRGASLLRHARSRSMGTWCLAEHRTPSWRDDQRPDPSPPLPRCRAFLYGGRSLLMLKLPPRNLATSSSWPPTG